MTQSHQHQNPAPKQPGHSAELTGPELEDVVSRVLARARTRSEPTHVHDAGQDVFDDERGVHGARGV